MTSTASMCRASQHWFIVFLTWSSNFVFSIFYCNRLIASHSQNSKKFSINIISLPERCIIFWRHSTRLDSLLKLFLKYLQILYVVAICNKIFSWCSHFLLFLCQLQLIEHRVSRMLRSISLLVDFKWHRLWTKFIFCFLCNRDEYGTCVAIDIKFIPRHKKRIFYGKSTLWEWKFSIIYIECFIASRSLTLLDIEILFNKLFSSSLVFRLSFFLPAKILFSMFVGGNFLREMSQSSFCSVEGSALK